MEFGLSLGSNLGDRLAHLVRARDAIIDLPGVASTARSHVYETEPVDVRPEYADVPFLNAVLIVWTKLAPHVLAQQVHEIEAQAGRVRTEDRNTPRPLDIDFIYADELTLDSPNLQLPHPRWAGRRFVVQPLADVRPDLVLPGQRHSVCEVLRSLPDSPKVALFAQPW